MAKRKSVPVASPNSRGVPLRSPDKEEYKAVLSPFFRAFYKIVDSFKCK